MYSAAIITRHSAIFQLYSFLGNFLSGHVSINTSLSLRAVHVRVIVNVGVHDLRVHDVSL